MDQELIAYLDTRFRETSQQIAETSQRIAETNQRITETQQQVAEANQRIAETQQQVANFREETVQRFEQLEGTGRQTLVLVEGLRHELQVVAEGFLGLGERLQRYGAESTVSFSKVQGWIDPYFGSLERRLTILEGRADRQNMDVVEAVRRILGRPPVET